MNNEKRLKVTLVRSINGTPKNHRECVKCLGLRRINHEVLLLDCSTVRGLVAKVNYLLNVEEV